MKNHPAAIVCATDISSHVMTTLLVFPPALTEGRSPGPLHFRTQVSKPLGISPGFSLLETFAGVYGLIFLNSSGGPASPMTAFPTVIGSLGNSAETEPDESEEPS